MEIERKLDPLSLHLRGVCKEIPNLTPSRHYLLNLRSEIAMCKISHLDKLINDTREDLQFVTRDPNSAKNAFITQSDIEVITIQASPGTKLEVPFPGEKIQLHLYGSKKPPVVTWIYRNQGDGVLKSRELQHSDHTPQCEQEEPIKDDDLFQQLTMDVTWDAPLLTEILDGISVSSLANTLRNYNDKGKQGMQLPFQTDNGFKTNDYVTSSQSESRHQQPIKIRHKDQLFGLDTNTPFDQHAFDLMFNNANPLPEETDRKGVRTCRGR